MSLFIIASAIVGCGGQVASLKSHPSTAPGEDRDAGQVPEDDITEDLPVPEKVFPARWEEQGKGSRDWTLFVYEQLEIQGPDLLNVRAADGTDFCPNYDRLTLSELKNFWVYLISSIAQFESNFNPALSYKEDFNDSSGQPVISRGLLQLSIESALGYGCPLANANDLHDPFKNLLCGIKILNRWVGRDGVIRANNGGWKGGARYWSVLRRDQQYQSIRSWTRARPYCLN